MTDLRQRIVGVSTLRRAMVVGSVVVGACSHDNPTNNATQQVAASCGTLSASDATRLSAERLESLGTVGLASLAAFEDSRSAARLLSLGHENIIDPFVSDAQDELRDTLAKLRDEQLDSADIEASSDSSITYLFSAEKQCEGTAPVVGAVSLNTGGASASGGQGGATGGATTRISTSCLAQKRAHPVRVRISRIACDQGDNIAIEVLLGTARKRAVWAELYAQYATVHLDLGAWLAESYSTHISSAYSNGVYEETYTEKPLTTAAAGMIEGRFTATGNSRASVELSITHAIDVTFADDSTARWQMGTADKILTAEADGSARTINLAFNTSALGWQTKFKYFISDFFNLETKSTADAAAPVNIHVAASRGTLSLDGSKDAITVTGLDLGGTFATAKQGSATLLSVGVANASSGALDANMTGNTDDSVTTELVNGLALQVRYGLAPVISMVQNPANFISDDTLTFQAPAGTELKLAREIQTNDITLASGQVGTLLNVSAGRLDIASATWPADAVSVSSNQCLAREVVHSDGHNDLLDDLRAGTCED